MWYNKLSTNIFPPAWGHFVAIANSVGSNDQNNNEYILFLNIMNEWYLRDLGQMTFDA